MGKSPRKLITSYRVTIERSLVLTLLFLLILFHSFPKRNDVSPVELAPVPYRFTIEEVPITHQSSRNAPRPQRPVIPVESEEPDVPEDATIDGTDMFFTGYSTSGAIRPKVAVQDTIPPRPLVQVLPEYPKELQKMNVRGFVRLMLWVNEKGVVEYAVVAENTTGTDVCENTALEAAKKSSYLPAVINKTPVAMWVSCSYSFRPN